MNFEPQEQITEDDGLEGRRLLRTLEMLSVGVHPLFLRFQGDQ